MLAAAVPAQLTLTSGNLVFESADPAVASHSPRALDLLSDPLQIDHGYEHWWFYRLAGDTREYSLRDVGGLGGGALNSEHGDRDFFDVDGRGLLKASLDFDAYSAGPTSGLVVSRLTVMNTSAAPLTLDTFCYTDLDIAGTAGDDLVTGDGESHLVTDSTGVLIEVRGIGANASQVGNYPSVRSLLTNAALDDLNNTLPPLTGDYTGAFQWTATLAPFEQRTFTVLLAANTPANVPPAVEHYGAGNGSHFETFATELPLQDLTQPRTFSVRMKGALPNSEYRIITGLDPWMPQPFVPGIDLWVLPPSIIAVYGGFTDASGEAAVTYQLPNSAYLTGISTYHQCFHVDPAAPNGFAYFTPGMRATIGRL
ncbi:MAG TPA: hypothetical protein ENI87_11145 [bacterium]|nr:hypothetical protein [bacterium]